MKKNRNWNIPLIALGIILIIALAIGTRGSFFQGALRSPGQQFGSSQASPTSPPATPITKTGPSVAGNQTNVKPLNPVSPSNICITPEEKIFEGDDPIQVITSSASNIIMVIDQKTAGGNRTYKSFDDGVTWEDMGDYYRHIAVSEKNPSLIYYDAFIQNVPILFRSDDGGKTFNFDVTTPAYAQLNLILPDRFDENKVYLFTVEDNMIFTSNDKGKTFDGGKPIYGTYDNIYFKPYRQTWDVEQDPQSSQTFYVVSEDSNHSGYPAGMNILNEGTWDEAKKYLLMITNDGFNTIQPYAGHQLPWHGLEINAVANASGTPSDLFIRTEMFLDSFYHFNGKSNTWKSIGVLIGSQDQLINPNNKNIQYMAGRVEGEIKCGYRSNFGGAVMVNSTGNADDYTSWVPRFGRGLYVYSLAYNEKTDTLFFTARDINKALHTEGDNLTNTSYDKAVYKVKNVSKYQSG